MGNVEVHFGPQSSPLQQAVREFAESNADPAVFQKPDSFPEDDDVTPDARELRAMVKAHDYWQRKPTPAQSNPFEDS